MSKLKIFFFAADPLSAPPYSEPRLRLAEEARQIRRSLRGARLRGVVEFHAYWDADPDDIMQELSGIDPLVLHFSGHGGSTGPVLVGPDGTTPLPVNATALTDVFEAFPAPIRLVVLNACYSRPQATAIAGVVGCAIGTHDQIRDDAAIRFSRVFYRAIGEGRSVQVAYDQARAAVKAYEVPEVHCPQLEVRPDGDARRLVLIPPESRIRKAAKRIGAAVVLLASGAALADRIIRHPLPQPGCASQVAAMEPSRTAVPATAGGASATEGDMAAAKALYESGNYADALPLFACAAEAGDSEAMGFLGLALLRGEGTAVQPAAAIHWLREATQDEDARGMYGLGVAFETGVGENQSDHWAKHWYTRAANAGFPEAMLSLGRLHLRTGTPADSSREKALAWFQKAADAGSPEGLVDAGHVHEKGLLGAPRDPEAAVALYDSAARAGSPRGRFAMGRIHHEGVIVPQDYAKARAWYLRAAGAKSADAMNNLGILYQNGLGVPRSRAKAARWYRRAIEAGSTEAESNLAALESGLLDWLRGRIGR